MMVTIMGQVEKTNRPFRKSVVERQPGRLKMRNLEKVMEFSCSLIFNIP